MQEEINKARIGDEAACLGCKGLMIFKNIKVDGVQRNLWVCNCCMGVCEEGTNFVKGNLNPC